MIAHGRKQISEMVYARKASEGGGAVRLTNMIRGGAVVFGGTVGMWLTFATRAAILGAFGDDGTAVIGATNAYLNGIAATDRTKAQALAALIYEDPMMVCSLGLEPTLTTLPSMPIRWMKTDGNAYVATEWRPAEDNTRIVSRAVPTQFGGSVHTYRLSGAYDGSRCPGVCCNYANSAIVVGSNDLILGVTLTVNKVADYDITIAAGRVTGLVNGTAVNKTYGGSQLTCQRKAYIFRCNEGSGTGINPYVWLAHYMIENGGTQERDYIPYKDKTYGLGLLDMANMVFYPNANSSGQFSEMFGWLENGAIVPWTPANQTN